MLFLAGRGKLRETRRGARAKEKARQNVNGADPRTACNKAERVVREAAELGGEGGGGISCCRTDYTNTTSQRYTERPNLAITTLHNQCIKSVEQSWLFFFSLPPQRRRHTRRGSTHLYPRSVCVCMCMYIIYICMYIEQPGCLLLWFLFAPEHCGADVQVRTP